MRAFRWRKSHPTERYRELCLRFYCAGFHLLVRLTNAPVRDLPPNRKIEKKSRRNKTNEGSVGRATANDRAIHQNQMIRIGRWIFHRECNRPTGERDSPDVGQVNTSATRLASSKRQKVKHLTSWCPPSKSEIGTLSIYVPTQGRRISQRFSPALARRTISSGRFPSVSSFQSYGRG